MALSRSLQRGHALCRHARLAVHPDELVEHPPVSAAVARKVLRHLGDVDHLFRLAEGLNPQRVFLHVAFDRAMRAQHADRSSSMRRKGRHHQLTERAVFHLHVHDLAVHHIVVAVIHAPAIGARPDRLADALLRRFLVEDFARPVGVARKDARLFVRQIDFLRIIRTVLLRAAARRASRRGALRRVLPAEVAQTAE